ncbi:MAG: flagellin [Motiliproteus sp.]
MTLVINSNIQSLNAQRNLTASGGDMDQAMERLSSGKRINSAADDAAGLAISSRLTSQVRGLDQAVRNANDGTSLIQTAEGALQESTNILQRMRELSIQSANGTFTDGNRATLNAEVSQLKTELTRIAETTTFNGLNILDGTLGDVALQVGAEANETITFNLGSGFDADALGTVGDSGSTAGFIGTAITDDNAVILADSISVNGQNLFAADMDFNSTGASAVGIETSTGLKEALDTMNTNLSGITASAYTIFEADTSGTGTLDATNDLTIAIAGAGTEESTTFNSSSSLTDLASQINSSMSTVVASVNDEGRLVLEAADGGTITLTSNGTGTAAAGFGTTTTQNSSIAFTSDDGEPIEITLGTAGVQAELTQSGLQLSGSATASGVVSGNNFASSAEVGASFEKDSLFINGTVIDNTDTDSFQGKLDAINAVSAQTGVTATAHFEAVLDVATADDDLTINGTTLTGDGTQTLDELVALINNADLGVTASLLSADGTLGTGQLTLTSSSQSFSIGAEVGTSYDIDGAGVAVVATPTTVFAGIQLESDNGSAISVDLKPGATAVNYSLRETNAVSGTGGGQSIARIDISTAAGAQNAIAAIDNALESVNNARADMGAVSNRLDFTVNNLSSISQNASAARSRIEDADFAAESAALSRAQVLQQAGTAMLAQANAQPQQVLSLLQ